MHHVRGNNYGRTEEVLRNLCSIQGALICMNRSIQAEGRFGIIKRYKIIKMRFKLKL